MKTKNSFKRLIAAVLCIMMIISFVPAYADEDPVSYDNLKAIVTAKIESLTLGGSAVDTIIEGINKTVTDTVTSMVMSVATTDNLKSIAVPLISNGIKAALQGYGITLPDDMDLDAMIEDIMGSNIVDQILSSDLVAEIIAKTVEYAIDDIMDDIAIPTSEEIIAAQKQELIQKFTDAIFAAPLVKLNTSGSAPVVKSFSELVGTTKATPNINTSLYNFTVNSWTSGILDIFKLPKTITITGWNVFNVEGYINLKILGITLSEVEAPDLSGINYQDVVLKALKKAAKDVITEKLEELKNKIKEAADKAIADAKAAAFEKINELLDDAGLDVTLSPDDTREQMEDKLKEALQDLTDEKKQELCDKLAAIKNHIKVKCVPMALAMIDNLLDMIRNIRPVTDIEHQITLSGAQEITIPLPDEAAVSESYSAVGEFRMKYIDMSTLPPACRWGEWQVDSCKTPVLTIDPDTLTGVSWDSATNAVTVDASAEEGTFEVVATYDYGCGEPLTKTLVVSLIKQKVNPPEPSQPVTITKTANKTSAKIGDSVTYTVTLKNNTQNMMFYVDVEDYMNDSELILSEDDIMLYPGMSYDIPPYDYTFNTAGTYINVVTAYYTSGYPQYTDDSSDKKSVAISTEYPSTMSASTSASVKVTVTEGDSEPAPVIPETPTVPNVTLTVNIEGQGTILPGAGTYSRSLGSIQVFGGISAAEGWEFVGWQGADGSQVSGDQILLDGNKQVTAVFKEIIPEPTPVIEEPQVPESAPEDTIDQSKSEVIDEAVPQAAPELPKTGGLPIELLMSAGGLLAATGFMSRRKRSKE